MHTENTDTQEVTFHVVKAEVHAAHAHGCESVNSWLNFSSENDVTVPVETSLDRNLFEFLNEDDDLNENRLAAANREKADRNLFECEFWKVSSDLDEGEGHSKMGHGHFKNLGMVSCEEIVQDSWESSNPINVTIMSRSVECPTDYEHPPTACRETESNVSMVSDGLECLVEGDHRYSIPGGSDPERDDSTPGRGSGGPGKDSSTFDRSFDGTQTGDTALDEHFSRCGLSPIPWVLDDEEPRRKWTTHTGSNVNMSSTIVIDDEASGGAESDAPDKRNFTFNFQTGDNEMQVVPRSSPPGGDGVAYLAPDGFIIDFEDSSLVIDSCGRCNETGFTGKSARDKLTLPDLVKPFGNITPMREKERDLKATNIRTGKKRVQPFLNSSCIKKPRTTTINRFQCSFDSQMSSSSPCDSEEIIQVDGPPPDLDTVNKTMVESLAACADHGHVNTTSLERIENAVCDVIPGGGIDMKNRDKSCNAGCEITGAGGLLILEDKFLSEEIKDDSKQKEPGKNVPETNERCDSDFNETGSTYCKQFSDSSDTEPLLDLSDFLLRTLPRQPDELQLLPGQQQQHDDDCGTTLPSIDTDLLLLPSGLSDQSVSVDAGSLEDLNSVSLDLELLTPLQNGGLKTTIDTYLNDSLLDEEVDQIFSSSVLKKNGDISVDLDSVMAVLEGELKVSNPSLTCHENFQDFEKNLSPCDIKEESEIPYRPLTPEGAGSAVLPSCSSGCASGDELKSVALGDVLASEKRTCKKRKLQFNGLRSNSKKKKLNVVKCAGNGKDRNSEVPSQPGSASDETRKRPCVDTGSHINKTSGYPVTPTGLKPIKKSSRTERQTAKRLEGSDRESVKFEAVNRTVAQLRSDIVLEHVLDKVLDGYRSQPRASAARYMCNDRGQILGEVRNGELAKNVDCESVQKLGQKSGHELGEVLSTFKQHMQCERDGKVFVKKIEFGTKHKRLRLSLTARRQIRAQSRAKNVAESVPTLDHNYSTSWEQGTDQGAGPGQGTDLKLLTSQVTGSRQGTDLKLMTSQGTDSGQGTDLKLMTSQGTGFGQGTNQCYPLSYNRRNLSQVTATCSLPASIAQDFHHKSSEISATSLTVGRKEGAMDRKNSTSTSTTVTNGTVARRDSISETSACVKEVKRKQVNKDQGHWRPSILRVSSTTSAQRLAPPAGSTKNLNQIRNQSIQCVRGPPPVTRAVNLTVNQVNHQVAASPGINQNINQSDAQVTRVVNVSQIYHQVAAPPPIKQNQVMAAVVPGHGLVNSPATGVVSNGFSRCVPTVSIGLPNMSCAASIQRTVTSPSMPVCNSAMTPSSFASGNRILYIPPSVINHNTSGLHPHPLQEAMSSGHTWTVPANGAERAPQNPKVYDQSKTANQLNAMATGHINGCQVITVTVPSRKNVSP